MIKHIVKGLIFIGFIGVILLLPQPSEAKSWNISNWDSQIGISEDGSFIVRETRTFDFIGSFSWVETDVYKDRVDDIVNFKVYDGNNNQLSSASAVITDNIDSVHVRLNFSATDEQKTWIFEYKVLGGIGFFENHDELYWNVLPMDREVGVSWVSAVVTLPDSADNLYDYSQTIYVGEEGSTQQSDNYTISDDRTIEFWGMSIGPYEGFTIVASWPKKLVQDPGTLRIEAKSGSKEIEGADIIIDGQTSGYETPHAFQISDPSLDQQTFSFSVNKFGYSAEPQELTIYRGETKAYTFNLKEAWWSKILSYILAVLAVIVWFLPILAFVFYYRRWKKYGQDPAQKQTVIAQYEPPKGILPSEMGALIDERVQLKDITPMIVDFAVRGYLTIEEIKPESKFSRKKDYRLVRTAKEPVEFREYETTMFNELFGSKKEIELSDLSPTFYLKIRAVIDQLYQSVVDQGYFEQSPNKVRFKNSLVPTLLIIISFVGLFFKSMFFIPLLFIGTIGLIFGIVMPKKTVKGAEASWWTKGFKLYLTVAERFRLGKMTPETFEKYLPYAMVLGVEKQWANRFKDIYIEPPKWFHSTMPYVGVFNVTNFTNQLSSFTVNTSSHLGSSRSSSSSGFSGGFSGGGGGGGSVSAG